jgi:GNAT superfamily N-acetyltransferase
MVMNQLTFKRGYREAPLVRNSFNELAEKVFGIHFENWYQKGYWTEKYQPFSFFDGERMVANVSVNKIDLVINKNNVKAIQIGTVMTHPNYRGRGLSRKLMEKVLDEYENEVDLVYLFANKTVLDFYPKFGFFSVEESLFSYTIGSDQIRAEDRKKVNPENRKDLDFIYKYALCRKPASSCFGAITPELVMFYCLYVFRQDIYYLEERDAIVLYKMEGSELHLFDIIMRTELDLLKVVEAIAQEGTEKIIFHFTPNCDDSKLEVQPYYGDEILFVKHRNDIVLPKYFKHPLTSQA